MNINELTIGQAKELSSLLGGQADKKSATEVPVEIGKSYLFRTVTHIEVGRVKAINGSFITLEEASWIPDTGRYYDCLSDGTFNEVEPYPETTTINAGSLINFCPWGHELPKVQK